MAAIVEPAGPTTMIHLVMGSVDLPSRECVSQTIASASGKPLIMPIVFTWCKRAYATVLIIFRTGLAYMIPPIAEMPRSIEDAIAKHINGLHIGLRPCVRYCPCDTWNRSKWACNPSEIEAAVAIIKQDARGVAPAVKSVVARRGLL